MDNDGGGALQRIDFAPTRGADRSFAKAAENAVGQAAKTARGIKCARVAELEMELDGKKIAQYRTTTRIYFEVEH